MNPVLVAVVAITVVLAVAFGLILLVGGTVGTRIAKRRDGREYLLDDAQDFDDEPDDLDRHLAEQHAAMTRDYKARKFPAVTGQASRDLCAMDIHEAEHPCCPARAAELDAWPQPTGDPNDEVTATSEYPQLRGLEIAELNRPATDEDYYAADHINIPRQTRRELP